MDALFAPAWLVQAAATAYYKARLPRLGMDPAGLRKEETMLNPPLLPPPLPDSVPGVLGAQPRVQVRHLSVREEWSLLKHRVQWIEDQYHSMELDHAREEGQSMTAPGKQESRPLFSSIKALALIALMRAALAVLDELSELIPA